MFFYDARRFDSASVGGRLVAVRCDRCGCDYDYELARVGSGSTTAPYGFGQGGAARASVEQAKRDLGSRLDHEAELVPCPACHWINEDLVSGYRAGRYRHWARFAAGSAAFGTIASLIGAWFVSGGPAADRGALPYFLYGGPAFFVATVVFVLGVRRWLRGRIQPNRDHPFPPSLPKGCPPALVMDTATGRLEVAKPRQEDAVEVGEWVDYQIGRHELPSSCCECLRSAAPGSSARQPVSPASNLAIPFCSPCARRWKRRRGLVGLAAFGLMFGAGLWALFALRLEEAEFWIFAVGFALFVLYVAAVGSYRLTAPFRLKIADASRGVVRLWFRNDEYCRRIASIDRPSARLPEV